ncbi:phosphotransferase [Gordonia jinghuaiqii]|uniref:Phosphotransferase family protein n=1 Tax=Gordonia jinghuaiqii TaxID=2758710 RepID=A0A7D7R4D2_9ACTN|nr:phosphotransferase family protein [Gordonia jinghuaiqii]MCR5980594.1 phosphotransferase [Gordonia jinghuaiqii]QMT02652.1 phosphotransferase family protein [Gordonia jinghuaiqii]
MVTDMRAALLDMLADQGIADLTTPVRLGGGSSQENWAFDAEFDTPAGRVTRALLLRREPARGVVDTPRDVEYALLRALGRTDLPVAAVHALDDGTRLERPAMVVDRLVGRADRAVLRSKDPLRIGREAQFDLAGAVTDLLADVHRVDVESTGLTEVLPVPHDPAEVEIDRWAAELDRVELEPHPGLREVLAWLRRHRPSPAPVSLVHGDFRPANVLVDGGALTALLDWELAHLGDAHDDLGWYTCSVYRREHFIDGRWGLEDFLKRWSAATGVEVDRPRLHFWQVMSVFRLAVIALAGVRGFCDGDTDRPAGPTTYVEGLALAETGMLAGEEGVTL